MIEKYRQVTSEYMSFLEYYLKNGFNSKDRMDLLEATLGNPEDRRKLLECAVSPYILPRGNE